MTVCKKRAIVVRIPHTRHLMAIRPTVAELCRFNCFQNGGRPPSWIFGIRNFIGR